jgi:tetratricopeptide (TPR) repeat protein
MRFLLSSVAFVLVCGQVAAARAETCPDVPDDEVALRRSMAKEWFAKAEEAEAAGDKQAAVRRYACSLNLAPHPSTAYNLGTVAEKFGDLAMAVDGFRAYLKLAPEATDRPTIEARIVTLESKISELRKLTPKSAVAVAVATPPPAPTPPVAVATPPASISTPAPAPADDGGHARHVAGWISLGGAVASLGGGVALNLEARLKMDDCRRLYAAGNMHALDRCDEAKPFAYGSYGLLGVAGTLAVVGVALFLWAPEAAATEETTPEVGFVPTRGGGAFVATGRF